MMIDDVKDLFENDKMIISLMNKNIGDFKFSTLEIGSKDDLGEVNKFETIYLFRDLIEL